MPYWPLQEKLNKNVDRIGATTTSAVNTLRDDAMNWRRFPGLKYFSYLGETLAVPYWWENPGFGVGVCGGKVFKLNENGNKTEITGATLLTGNRVYFADFGSRLFMANGGRIVSWKSNETTCEYISDVDTPQSVVSVAFFDLYLIALDRDGVIWFSEINDPDNWMGEFFTAESQPDKTVAIMSGWEEITAFGTKTTQGFYNSGEAAGPIVAIQGSTLERGIIAKDSVVVADNAFFFLDHERKVQRMAGRQGAIVSEAINAELQSLARVDDAIGTHLHCDGETLYCLVFPSDGVGWAYDYKRNDWTRFGSFSSGEYKTPKMHTACYFKGWNRHIAGGPDGKLYDVSTKYNNDAGDVSRFSLRIRMNWGTEKKKICSSIRIRCKRGLGLSGIPYIIIRYRNEDGSWTNEKWHSLGRAISAEQEFYIRINRLGQYRDREWELVVTDDVPVLIVSVEEDVEAVE